MYELLTQGISDLARSSQLLDLRKIVRDSLSGPIDGSNTVFVGNYAPALASGSNALFVGTVQQTLYTFNPVAAQFVFTTAPAANSAQIYANYTYSSLDSDTVIRLLFLGFDQMESFWSRGLRLSSSSSSYSAATESSSTIYIVGSSDTSDPTSNGVYFSTSRKQIAFYMKCCQYAYYIQRMYEEAAGGLSYKEAGGMAVNTEARARNLKLLLDMLMKELETILAAAQADWGSALGFAIHSPQSADYQENFAWQDGVSTANRATSTYNPYRGLTGLNG